MSTNKVGIRRLPTRPPLQPQSSAGEPFTATQPPTNDPDVRHDKYEASWWKRLLTSERRNNQIVQKILAATNTQLESQISDLRQQVADLRSAAIASTSANFNVRESR